MEFTWCAEKDAHLEQVRGVGFKQIVQHIQAGHLLDILEHPNPGRYPEQRVLVVEMQGYVYAVPYEKMGNAFHLKTVFPSRKLTRRYLGSENSEAD